MKTFKPFDKVLYRINKRQSWTPSFYQYGNDVCNFVLGNITSIKNENILPYKGNEHLVGICDEPEEEIHLAVDELVMVSDSLSGIKAGTGFVYNYSNIINKIIVLTNGIGYAYCIPMSKYDPNNLEKTRKWILKVQNGKLVKVNK